MRKVLKAIEYIIHHETSHVSPQCPMLFSISCIMR